MNSWDYESAADLDRSLSERLKDYPRQPDMLVYGGRYLSAGVLRGWLKSFHRYQVCNRERLPLGKSFVMVANHSSHLDALCLVSSLPIKYLHRAFPAAARDYFFESMPRTCSPGWL